MQMEPQKNSKALDIFFTWVSQIIMQNQLGVFWKPLENNLGDYHTNNYPTSHHKNNAHLSCTLVTYK